MMALASCPWQSAPAKIFDMHWLEIASPAMAIDLMAVTCDDDAFGAFA